MAHSVREALALCGVNDVNLFGGETQAQRLATEVFGNDFETCKDKTSEELKEDLKSYSQLTAANGRIRINPGQRRNIRAFMHWCKDQSCRGIDPTTVAFPVAFVNILLRQEQMHMKFVSKSKTIIDTAKPRTFTKEMKWDDWKPIFSNFLKSIPGFNGIPLSYVIRDNDAPDMVTV